MDDQSKDHPDPPHKTPKTNHPFQLQIHYVLTYYVENTNVIN